MTVRIFIEKLKLFKNDNTSYCISLWKDENTDVMYFYISSEKERKAALEKAKQYLDCEVTNYSIGYNSIGLTIQV